MTLLRAVVVLAALGAASSARAHFVLDAPPSWMSQDPFGLPQKGPPCGDEGGGTATNIVTAYRAGDSVTITIDEKVYHPGHYRVALATGDRSVLLAEPAVVEEPGYACGTAAIQDPPVFPVLADNLLPHTSPFSAPQTVTITLPSNVTCDKCTLQVIEFMSDHGLNNPGGCFYHHCADISISAPTDDGGALQTPADQGVSLHGDASASMPPAAAKKSSGCSVVPHAPVAPAFILLLAFGFFVRRVRNG